MEYKIIDEISLKYKISYDTLAHLLDTNKKDLPKIYSDIDYMGTLSEEKISSFFYLLDMLSEGIESISSVDRLRGVIDVLNSDYKLSYETISIYGQISEKELVLFMNGEDPLTSEKMFNCSVRIMMLLQVVNRS